MICEHMAQRLDAEGVYWCVDCGAECGTGEMFLLDEPLSPDAVAEMRRAWGGQQ